MKKRAKKNFAEEKKYLYGTGGGPPQKDTNTDIEKDIQEIIGTQLTGFTSELDNDVENIGIYNASMLLIVPIVIHVNFRSF